jgi:effector-binding domain-containing protein
MISKPEVLQTQAEAAAVIHISTPRWEMAKVFGPAVAELMATLATQGIEPAGAVFAHHFKMSPDNFDFELGVKVPAPVTATGRVLPGELPAALVARTIYSGPYEGLSAAWGEFGDWIKANGHCPAGNLWEIYSVGPHATPDPSGWRTELVRPLVES